MKHPAWHWALALAALVAGYLSYGAAGVALAVTVIVFWLLLQFTRAIRVMRQAGDAPVGQVPSAVMLHTRLRPGMTLMKVLPLAGSLGQAVGDDADERFRWTDGGGRSLTAVFSGGRLVSWELSPPAEPVDTGEAR